jgi:hypothetical protein
MDYDSDEGSYSHELKFKVDELEREVLNIKSAIRFHAMQMEQLRDENNRLRESMHKLDNKVQRRGHNLKKE